MHIQLLLRVPAISLLLRPPHHHQCLEWVMVQIKSLSGGHPVGEIFLIGFSFAYLVEGEGQRMWLCRRHRHVRQRGTRALNAPCGATRSGSTLFQQQGAALCAMPRLPRLPRPACAGPRRKWLWHARGACRPHARVARPRPPADSRLPPRDEHLCDTVWCARREWSVVRAGWCIIVTPPDTSRCVPCCPSRCCRHANLVWIW
jgi:hypothetical protein